MHMSFGRSSVPVVVLVALSCALLSSSALASSGAVALRRAFGQVFLAAKTGNPSACSQATARGRISLTEFARGQEHYLPSTTCQEAIAGLPKVEAEKECGFTAAELAPAVRTAMIHVARNHATVQLTEDAVCGSGTAITGSAALPMDPMMATTHWTLKRRRWLYDDEPTGTYSRQGRKAAAMLRAALTGSTITETIPNLPPYPAINGAAFCANGATQLTLFSNPVPNGGTWYVIAGYSMTTQTPGGPPFDAQGNPQGAVIIDPPPTSIEWGLTLTGGTIAATQPPADDIPLVFHPGDAHC